MLQFQQNQKRKKKMKPLPKDLVDVVSRVMKGAHPLPPVVEEEIVLTEEEECVNKPEAEEPTANHGAAEAGNAGDKTPPTQGSSDTTKFYMAPNAQVMHAKEGKGNVLATMGEGVDEVAEVMFKESLKRIPVWELEPVEE